MKQFDIRLVGQPAGPVTRIEAVNEYQAVAEVAQCAVNDVMPPIWRQGFRRLTWGQLEAGINEYEERCYMPIDNSGRQWLVRDGRVD